MLADHDRYDAAADVLERHLRAHPDATDERRLLVRVHALRGDLAAVRRETTRLAKDLGPRHPVPWIELGHAYELAHRYDDALSAYDKAADIAPRDPRGPREGGVRAARWGELDWAEPRLAEAVRRDPKDAASWHALGVVRVKLRDLRGATRAYERGLRADPQALENRLGLATIAVLRKDGRSALHHYSALAAARPKLASAHLGRSWALILLGRFADAERSIERALKLGGDRSAIRRQLALLARARAGAKATR